MSNLLSVIVPVYRVEEYLPTCIESILNQTYTNIELFLVDDGSPDRCGKICDEYAKKDARIKVIHKENGGQGSARNRAIDIANGDYLAFVDSDDYIEPDMYETMIEALERTNSDIALCGFKTHSGIRCVNSSVPEEEYLFHGAEEILKAYFSSPVVDGSPCNKVFLRAVFDGIRFPEGVAREDVYIMHHLFARCNKAVHTGKCFYNYIIREGSSEHQKFHPKFLISIQIADERCEFIKERFPNLIPLAQKSCYGSRMSAIKKIVRSDAVKQYKEIYDELIDYLRKNPAPTKEQERLRRMIVNFPAIYKLKMNMNYKYRQQIKKLVCRMKHMKK